ncbi:MAG TPA: ISAs1 family transposase [Candidatus Methylomirabilis sp.]|nr:ISAs1 family transposase [Candidatus Methylomirabilis sp.]
MKSTESAVVSNAHGPLTVRVLTDLTERQRFDALLDAEHFLGPRFPAGDRLYQVAEQDGQWVGLLLWCASALHLKDRDAWIGWDPLTRAQRLKLIVNQARFLIPETARRPNAASQILAAATTALPDQWFAHHGYAPLLAETFTDPEAHAGTCYKAAGWEPVGKTVGFERHRCDFFAFHDRPKRLWLKPLAPQAKEQLCAAQLCARHAPALTVGAAARCALNAPQRYSLKEALRQVPDPRRKQGQRYPLAPTLTVVALALLAGQVDLSQIQRFGTRLSQAQRKALGFWPKPGTRFYPVPTYTVLRDLLMALDLDALAQVLTRWLQSQAGRLPASLALDGKTIRDHLGCIVSLVEHQDGAPVALIAAPNKGYELPAAQELLRSNAVNLLGCLITADPLHCQTETAQIITQEKGGDYVLGVKDNQPTVRHNTQQKLTGATPLLSRPNPAVAASKPAP